MTEKLYVDPLIKRFKCVMLAVDEARRTGVTDKDVVADLATQYGKCLGLGHEEAARLMDVTPSNLLTAEVEDSR